MNFQGSKFISFKSPNKEENYNTVHGDKPNDPPKEWTINSPAVHLNYQTSTPRTSNDKIHITVVSGLIGKMNHNSGCGDIEVYPYKYMPYPYTTGVVRKLSKVNE